MSDLDSKIVLDNEISKFKNEIRSDLVREIRDDILNEQMKNDIKKDLKKEIMEDLFPKKDSGFFNRNPIFTFFLFSFIVIFLFKIFIG